jgi:hypothetical protein
MVKCWGQEPDEEMQPIPWIEWPTGALVGASSFWPILTTTKDVFLGPK